ncbi:MAG: archaeosortase/exosortase family protein [Candidatus Eisenbacteria bacterium]|uniref:Archaeosortase/exosortase family protein n=1 Tax=Eiseniibacteriota bacterium TaxID=2212470 RepID=A0A7Y2H140_UNCEI|nr:archaeosortase/exosortase family protein [Candidatus Eisenbacteria bacterium]
MKKSKPKHASAKPARKRAYKFVAIFAMGVVLVYAFLATPWAGSVFNPWQFAWSAQAAGGLLQILGKSVVTNGSNISSPEYSIAVRNGCDAAEPIGLFLSAVVAFPVAFRKRLMGAVAGIVLLLALNTARIASLYWVGAEIPGSFDFFHGTLWPICILLLAGGAWLFWAQWALKRKAIQPTKA